MQRRFLLALISGVALVALPGALAADQAADKAAIERAIESYTAAFNARDPQKLAAHWGPEAVYTNPLTGTQVEGREAIVKEFTTIFAEVASAKLVVQVESIQFLSPNVAVEQGTANLISPDKPSQSSRYTALHVKRDGKWLLDRVSEQEESLPPSQYDKLQPLEWMIGTWVDQDEQATVEMTCQWAKNQAFLTRAFTISIGDRIDMSGMQIIGWDARQRRIRSWVFDSDGGFGEATWTKKDQRWIVNAAGTLPDGRRTSAINILTILGKDTITWQSTGRSLDGEILPNLEAVQLTRQGTAKSK